MRHRMPSRRSGRRWALAGAAAAAVTALGVLAPMAPLVAAEPTRPHAAGAKHHHDEERAGELNDVPVPAPPAPPQRRPAERVVVDPAAAKARGADRSQANGKDRPAVRTVADGAAGGATIRTADLTGPDAARTVLTAAATASRSGAAAPGGGTAKTLVLYDNTGPYAWLGEVYAQQIANLTSHFGAWTAHPVGSYTAGELAGYTAVIYVGSTYDEPVPVAFLDDVLATTKPVVWMYDNIWQLTARAPDFAGAYGFTWKQFDTATVGEVRYRGTSLTRDTRNLGGIMDHVVTDPAKVTTVGEAVRADGSTFPWAVRSHNLTYLGEIPLSYVTHDDRYLAFSDMLYDALAPATGERHRALVRIEDVGPDADPAELRAIADYLYSRRVPFSVAVYTRYRDPVGVHTGGVAEDYTLAKRPQVVSALKYMVARGGTLIMHGYTHQYKNIANPYDGVSANDFEFYRSHVDATDTVRYDGPVLEDSASWFAGRVNAARNDYRLAGLPQPTIWEFPHYAGSVVDYKQVNTMMGVRYDRGLYFPGHLSGGAIDYTKVTGQFYPYTVRDVYGSTVLPENIGNIEPESFNNHPARFPADLIASARRNLVVRDGMASFFYHPYLGLQHLRQVVEGVQGLGYRFVAAGAILDS
jgi:uncharacterized protein YdaL